MINRTEYTVDSNLKHFHEQQNEHYKTALQEIQSGLKTSHWIWYIFPQPAGLGTSQESLQYAINNLSEAYAYLNSVTLLNNYNNILQEVIFQIIHKKNNLTQLMGSELDAIKFSSSVDFFYQITLRIQECSPELYSDNIKTLQNLYLQIKKHLLISDKHKSVLNKFMISNRNKYQHFIQSLKDNDINTVTQIMDDKVFFNDNSFLKAIENIYYILHNGKNLTGDEHDFFDLLIKELEPYLPWNNYHTNNPQLFLQALQDNFKLCVNKFANSNVNITNGFKGFINYICRCLGISEVFHTQRFKTRFYRQFRDKLVNINDQTSFKIK